MDILTMNKEWIEASHYHAHRYRRNFLHYGEEHSLPIYEYLDAIGLFETGWMIYDFDKYENESSKYEYPR